MLRLADDALILWRSTDSVQLGLDARVVLEAVLPWHDELLGHLVRGIPDGLWRDLARNAGALGHEADDFLALLAPALDRAAPAPVVRLMAQDDLTTAERTVIDHAVIASGLTVADAAHRGVPVILISRHLTDPRAVADFMVHDTTHVPLALGAAMAHVGPVVLPGVTACVTCIHLDRRDREPTWPIVAAQALVRPALGWDLALVTESLRVAGALLTHVTDPSLRQPESTHSVTVRSRDVHREWTEHRPHSDCSCQSLEEIETPAARAPRVRVPTTATAYARRA